MSNLVDILTSAFGGSLVGAVGAAFTKWHEAKLQITLAQMEIEKTKIAQDHELEMAKVGVESKRMETDATTLIASMEADKATYTTHSQHGFLIFVDGFRGLIRPLLTSTLLIYCMVTLFYLTKHYTIPLANDQVYKLVFMLVENLVVCSGIALTWWFGARPSKDRMH